MCLDGTTLEIIESGWYKESKRIENMKNDPVYKNFQISDIFQTSAKLSQLKHALSAQHKSIL